MLSAHLNIPNVTTENIIMFIEMVPDFSISLEKSKKHLIVSPITDFYLVFRFCLTRFVREVSACLILKMIMFIASTEKKNTQTECVCHYKLLNIVHICTHCNIIMVHIRPLPKENMYDIV